MLGVCIFGVGQGLWVWGEVCGVDVSGFGFPGVVGGDSCIVGMVGLLGGVKKNVSVVRVVCPVAVEVSLLLRV